LISVKRTRINAEIDFSKALAITEKIISTTSLTHWPPVYKYSMMYVLGNRGKTRDILVDLPTA